MADINLFSYVGPQDNDAAHSLGDLSPLPAGTNWASPIKISGGVQRLTVAAGIVDGGHDAVVDVNNHATDITVFVAHARPRGEFVQTVKGGAKNVHSNFPAIEGHGSVCDFIYDDYSDQSHDATKDCGLNATMKDGSAVYVIALKTKPSLFPGSGPYRFSWWQPLNLRVPFTTNYYVVGFIFDTLRRWSFFRAASNSP